MSRYRNYRRPYQYRHRRYGGYSQPFEPLKGIFIIGVAFILLGSVASGASGDFAGILWKIFVWGLLLAGAAWILKKIRNGARSPVLDEAYLPAEAGRDPAAALNSEKHGCKCYMDGLTHGEREIARILAEGLSYKDYFIFNNLTIPSDYNGSSQIDHLVVSRFGIFVIESKDMGGLVLGGKDQKYWTESFGHGKNHSFPNPIRQNWSHIMSLKQIMPFVLDDDFKNVVVFSGSLKFRSEPIDAVVHSGEVVGYIQRYAEPRVSEEDIHLILGKLSYVCQTADISPAQHIENLHSRHDPKVGAADNPHLL